MLAADAVDFAQLSRTQTLLRVEAPDALHQALAAQDFMTAGDAAMKIVGDVEQRAVAIGDASIERQQVGGQSVLAPRGAAHLELLYRARGPHRPVPQQAAP